MKADQERLAAITRAEGESESARLVREGGRGGGGGGDKEFMTAAEVVCIEARSAVVGSVLAFHRSISPHQAWACGVVWLGTCL